MDTSIICRLIQIKGGFSTDEVYMFSIPMDHNMLYLKSFIERVPEEDLKTSNKTHDQ